MPYKNIGFLDRAEDHLRTAIKLKPDFAQAYNNIGNVASDKADMVTAQKYFLKSIELDPSKANDFSEGDILVTGMTRPEYIGLVKKSAGFITDAGGTLSHAAITARELKKPCVVATQVATQVLKDGMEVELDADNGIVTIK